MTLPSKPILFAHVIGWLFFLSLPLIFISTQGQREFTLLYNLPLYWIYFSVYPFLFYLHTFYLFPKFYLGKKYVVYFSIMLAMTVAVYYLRPFDRTIASLQQPFTQGQNSPNQGPPDQRNFPGGPPSDRPGFQQPPIGPPPMDQRPNDGGNRRGPMLDIVSILFFVLTIGLSITMQAIRRWRLATRMAAQAETDKVNAELSFLKAQINPHFLFNTLNNIYSLAISKDDNTADSIMRLSNIMRYVTDEVSSNFVSLQSEADCIADYIDLQRLRLSKKVEIDYTTKGNLEAKSIAPLILMTFVENVFKYGISSHEHSPITIRIAAEEYSITFFSQNRIFPANEINDREGIGIANNKKRLSFLYPNEHLLNIDTSNQVFTVTLTLQTYHIRRVPELS